MPSGVSLLQHRRFNHKERLVTRKSGDVEAHPLQERLVKDDIDQAQMFRGAVPVRTRPVVHKNITCFDWKLLFPDDVDPVAPRDDDDHSEIMNVQRVIGMFFEEEHIQREIPVRKHKFPFKFDGLNSANGCGGIHPPTTGSLRRLSRIF